jgi:hypothetical protein
VGKIKTRRERFFFFFWTYSILEEGSAGRGLGKTQQRGQSDVLSLTFLCIDGESDGDGQGADEDLASKPAHVVWRLAADIGDDGIVSAPGSGMIEGVAAGEEYLCELFVIVGHHGGAGCFFGHGEEVVDVFDGAKGFLPELELDGGVELGEAGVEVVLEGVCVGEVDRVGLVGILGDVGEMETESFAETTELDFSLVLETEFEGLLSYLLRER